MTDFQICEIQIMTGFLNAEVSQITQRGRTGLVLKDIGEVRRGKFHFAGNIRQTDFFIQVFLHTRKTPLAVLAQKLHGTQKMKEARGGVQHVVLVVAGTDRGINLFEQHQPFLDAGMLGR